ncbi:MAG: hypothetical protein ABIZ91_14855 [Gemmatimonadaceae bacterium]
MSLPYSVLALGTRADAGEWERGCSKVLGQTRGVVLRKARPTLDELETVFDTEAAWLYVGAHSMPGKKAAWLFNDLFDHDAPSRSPEGAVLLQLFPTNAQLMRYQPVSGKVGPVARERRVDGRGFALRRSLRVSLWAGCALLQPDAIPILRSLFRPHLMLGFYNPVSSDAVFEVLKRDPLMADERTLFFERAQPDPEDPKFVMDAWFTGALHAHQTPEKVRKFGFAAVDAKGERWVMSAKGKVQRG